MESSSGAVIKITGVGLVSPMGIDAESTWRGVLQNRNVMGPMPALESPLPAGKNGGQAVDLPADFAPDLPREARYLRFAIDAALRSARMDSQLPCAPGRVAFMLGTTLHGMRAGGRFLRSGDFDELQSFLAGDTLRLATAHLPFSGGSATTCSACSSSLGSIALGVTLLQSGAADLVIAGGYDAVSEYAFAGFNALRLVSDPPLRPFTKGRIGMKLSEAYAIVILQRADDAKRAIATIAGWGESADAHHLTQPHPQGTGALAAMRQALGRANIQPSQLGLIAAHATGTPDNDASEAAALTQLLGEEAGKVPVVAFKSHLGHTLGGAGAAELILSAMALQDQIIPATAHVKPEEIEYPQLRIVHGESSPAKFQYTLNTSLGFGGANTCVALTVGWSAQAAPAAILRKKRQAVITGIGVLLPDAVGNEVFAARVKAGTPFNPQSTLDDADFQHLLNARRTRRMSTYVKLTLAAVSLACADAGLPAGFDAAAVLGTMHGSAAYSDEYYAQIVREGMLAANPMLFAEGVPNAGAAQLSLMLGLKDACQTIIGTRTSGLDALRFAAMRIEAGDVDRVLVSGGEESYVTVNDTYAHAGLRKRSDGAGGFVNFPGAVTLVLESAESAVARGARVYGTVAESRSAHGPKDAMTPVIAEVLIPAARTLVSANCTWIDAAEQAALGDRQIADYYPVTGELFGAHGLVAMAAELLAGTARDFTTLVTDFSGVASAVRIERT